ncbi:sodium:calcium antiporter [Candidatus Micrarchaeota archaeon]|nr:sodium:calcium antiporter [Candidatus Micrarchaeota archaeon]
MVVENTLLMAAGLAVLVKSSLVAVRSLASVSWHFRLSEFFTSFLIVGLVSTIPELFIGVNSALDAKPELGWGVVIGSNIIDLTIILGIVTIYARNLPVRAKFIKSMPAYLVAISLPVVLLADGKLDRLDGLLLVGAMLAYVWFVYKKTGTTTAKSPPFSRIYSVRRSLVYAPLSIAIMFVSSDIVARNAEQLSILMSVPVVLIGMFVVALGTCLPELIFSVRAVRERHKGLAVGDIFGNVVIDSTSSIGIIALITPIAASGIALRSGIFMLAAALILMALVTRERGLKWPEGIALVLTYVAFAALGVLSA